MITLESNIKDSCNAVGLGLFNRKEKNQQQHKQENHYRKKLYL